MKSKAVFILLSFFLGGFGVHWFYLGRHTRGAIYLCLGFIGLFLWIPLLITVILSIIDIIMIVFMSKEAFDNEYNSEYINLINGVSRPNMNQYNQQPLYTESNQAQSYTIEKKSNDDFKSKAQKLTDLKALLDSGVLTQEEFDVEKKKILNV